MQQPGRHVSQPALFMENLISDLALILISAGIVTLLFKRLRQPLVLG